MESPVEKIEILKKQLGSSDEETRRLAVAGLVAHPVRETRDYLFAALGDASWRVRKEAVEALLAASVSVEIIEELVRLLASHDNAGMRNSAVEALEKLGAQAMPILCRHVADADHDVRKFVIDILGSIGDAAAVPLLARALDDPEPNVSAAAAENLGKIGDAQALPYLLQALGKTDIWFRYTILDALSKIGKPVPMAIIAPLAGENLLKKAVFDCLGAVGDNEAVPLLLEGLRERVRHAREAAAAALMKVRERLCEGDARQLLDEKLKGFSGAPFVEGLLSSLDTSDRNLQESLVKLLGIIGDERAIGRLLHGCSEERLRRYSLQAFKSMGETAAAALMGFFPGADEEERCFIAYLCGELRYRGCAPLLKEGMSSASPELRRVSVIAAGKTGQSALCKEISHLLDDTESGVRDGAIEAFSRMAGENGEAVLKVAGQLVSSALPQKRRDAAILFAALADADKLSLLIKDEDAIVRKTAVNALSALKKESTVGHLVMALVDEEADVRIAAAGALGEIGGEDVLEPLLLILKDEDPWVRCAALKSLGKLRHAGARQAIVELLDSAADGLLTIAALNALAEIDGESVLEPGKKALANPDEEVVKAAIEILSRHGDVWLDEYRDRLLAHPHWDVRKNFIKVMVENWGAKAVPYLKSALESESDDLVKEQILNIMDRFK
jgi:HEAT repeat protein